MAKKAKPQIMWAVLMSGDVIVNRHLIFGSRSTAREFSRGTKLRVVRVSVQILGR